MKTSLFFNQLTVQQKRQSFFALRRCYSSYTNKLKFTDDEPICENLRKLFCSDNFEKKVDNISARILTDKRDITMAQHTIYNSLREIQWKWTSDNSEGFKIRKLGSLRYISDDYEDNSFWTGAFCNGDLIGCVRALYRTTSKHLNVDKHYLSQSEHFKIYLQKLNLVEIQYMYTQPQHRSKGVNFLCLHVLTNALKTTNQTAIFVNNLNFYHQKGIGTLLSNTFDKDDEVNAKAMYWSEDDIDKVVEISREECLKRIQSKTVDYSN